MKDFSDQVIGTYLVLWKDEEYKGKTTTKWYVQCLKCGNVKSVFARGLTRDKSCGCLRFVVKRGFQRARGWGHRPNKDKVYWAWVAMRSRCFNPKGAGYKNYGGRGISISEEWMIYENFERDMRPTYQKGLSLDRIDNNGNYCKENCRWTTKANQSRNRRGVKLSMDIADVIRASEKSNTELAAEYNVNVYSIDRIKRGVGWTNNPALSEAKPFIPKGNYRPHQTRLYRIWAAMKQRCLTPTCDAYHNYGGRGIKIHPPWLKFKSFKRDMEHGYRDDLSLDRIDVNGNYEPSNCRWATKKEQCRNTRRCKLTQADADYIRSTNHPPRHYRLKFNIGYGIISSIKKGFSWA